MYISKIQSVIFKWSEKKFSYLKKMKGRTKKYLLSIMVVLTLSMAVSSTPQAVATPTLFSFPTFSPSGIWNTLFRLGNGAAVPDSGAVGQSRRVSPTIKPYSGLRLNNDSLVMVYFYDQTIAVVELGPNKLLLNCELIEVNEETDKKYLLNQLSKQLNVPYEISFNKMIKLMSQCHQVEGAESLLINKPPRVQRMLNQHRAAEKQKRSQIQPRGLLDNSPLSLLSGIIPGTKWCGTGDIADNYFDLGADKPMDRCCRTHDLCPVKVKAFSQKYNLTNNSIYSKSHCKCDDALFSCLKKTNTSASQIMGDIYFNLVKVQCVEEGKSGRGFRDARSGF